MMEQLDLFSEQIENQDVTLSGILNEMIVLFNSGNATPEKAWRIFQNYKLRFLSRDKLSVQNINELVKFTIFLQNQEGIQHKFLENEIFNTLKYLITCLLDRVERNEIPLPFERTIIEQLPYSETKKTLQIVREITDFVIETLRLKDPENQWLNERQYMALDLLFQIFSFVRCMKLLENLFLILQSENETDVLNGLDILNRYYFCLETPAEKKMVHEILLKILENAMNEDIIDAVNAIVS